MAYKGSVLKMQGLLEWYGSGGMKSYHPAHNPVLRVNFSTWLLSILSILVACVQPINLTGFLT